MAMKMFDYLRSKRHLPYIVAFLGLITYTILAVHLIHHIQPVMDEASYLLKGRWFLEGTYTPFQDYGPITNKPPLSFFILGIPQILFGAGLRSGRYFALFLSILLLVGQWLTVKRNVGDWWAAASILLYCISPAWIIYYSRALTQVISALLVIWSLHFILGRERKSWEILIGASLAAITVMVRQNMLPFYALIIIFLLISKGIKKVLFPIVFSILIFIALNAIYWPEIYVMIWQPFIPEFLDRWVYSLFNITNTTGGYGQVVRAQEYIWINELAVVFDGIRYFFIPFFTSFITLFYIKPYEIFNTLKKKEEENFFIFLSSTFILLTIIHIIGVIRISNALYSYPAYISFYLPIGVVNFALIGRKIIREKGNYNIFLLITFLVVLFSGIGLSLYPYISDAIMQLKVPSFSQRKLFGDYALWDVLLHRFNIQLSVQQFLLPTVAGFFTAIIVILVLFTIHKSIYLISKNKMVFHNFLLVGVLITGIISSPLPIFAGKGSIQTCNEVDVILHYEKIGTYLDSVILSDSKIYWEGFAPIPLLYISDPNIHPALLNAPFNYFIGGDAQFLEKWGYWNDELAKKWIKEADFVLLSSQVFNERQMESDLNNNYEYKKWKYPESINPCNPNTTLYIFEKID